MDAAPADLEEEGRWEPQHHLDVLGSSGALERGRSAVHRTEQSRAGTREAVGAWALAVNVHDAHTHMIQEMMTKEKLAA